MSTEKINETKEKILNWLKEEAYSPEEKTDPNAYFNIAVKAGKLGCNIVQFVQKRDSIIAILKINLTPEQVALLKGIGAEKKKEFFWDLKLSLLRNNELGDFNIEAKSPEDMKSVVISSRPIYYDDLTKGRLVSAIFTVTKAALMVIWMLQKYAGKIPSKKDQKLPYLT